MNFIIDYQKGIHKDCGKKYEIYKDIIITPFYTEKFCKEIVQLSEKLENYFENNIVYFKNKEKSPWKTLYFSKISSILFNLFFDQYQKYIIPLINKNFPSTFITGLFSPMIIKYDEKGQNVDLHNDTSLITLNVKLNNNYEGCDLEFPRQNWSNKNLPVGYCFLWPSQVTHPHVAKPLIKGKKYVISSWSHPVSWEVSSTGGSIIL